MYNGDMSPQRQGDQVCSILITAVPLLGTPFHATNTTRQRHSPLVSTCTCNGVLPYQCSVASCAPSESPVCYGCSKLGFHPKAVSYSPIMSRSTVLHCTALYCTVLHCTARHGSEMYCIPMTRSLTCVGASVVGTLGPSRMGSPMSTHT
jgi:hypothetical protein